MTFRRLNQRAATVRSKRERRAHRVVATAACASWFLVSAAWGGEPAWVVVGGNAQRGAVLMSAFGCGSCHTVPGLQQAHGNIGPPLTRFGDRTYIAGMLRNEPAELVRWIRFPQSVVPGNAMPDMGISEQEARDIAAYLYTLR